MKHLDFGQALVRLPMAARLVKAVPVWMLLANAIGPLTAQQLFVNACCSRKLDLNAFSGKTCPG
jgi:hypothetical protein